MVGDVEEVRRRQVAGETDSALRRVTGNHTSAPLLRIRLRLSREALVESPS
jgi:hypothetical protein